MKVLVTGGSGRLGTGVIRDLLEHGYDVVNADRRPTAEPTLAAASRFIDTDLTDVGQVAGAMSGCDRVIHLGAIPVPYLHADEVVFRNNTGATFAVLQAASLLRIKKAAIASSLSALGTAWSPEPFPPLYAPVDEAHPLLNQEPYGLSKEVDERIAEMFHRRTGMEIAAFRFCLISHMDEAQAIADRIRQNPGDTQEWRVLWAYVDVADAAAACRRGIEAEGFGFAPFNITASDTLSDIPTEALLRRYTPSTEIRAPIPGTSTAFSISAANEKLGWQPALTWRT